MRFGEWMLEDGVASFIRTTGGEYSYEYWFPVGESSEKDYKMIEHMDKKQWKGGYDRNGIFDLLNYVWKDKNEQTNALAVSMLRDLADSIKIGHLTNHDEIVEEIYQAIGEIV